MWQEAGMSRFVVYDIVYAYSQRNDEHNNNNNNPTEKRLPFKKRKDW